MAPRRCPSSRLTAVKRCSRLAAGPPVLWCKAARHCLSEPWQIAPQPAATPRQGQQVQAYMTRHGRCTLLVAAWATAAGGGRRAGCGDSSCASDGRCSGAQDTSSPTRLMKSSRPRLSSPCETATSCTVCSCPALALQSSSGELTSPATRACNGVKHGHQMHLQMHTTVADVRQQPAERLRQRTFCWGGDDGAMCLKPLHTHLHPRCLIRLHAKL